MEAEETAAEVVTALSAASSTAAYLPPQSANPGATASTRTALILNSAILA